MRGVKRAAPGNASSEGRQLRNCDRRPRANMADDDGEKKKKKKKAKALAMAAGIEDVDGGAESASPPPTEKAEKKKKKKARDSVAANESAGDASGPEGEDLSVRRGAKSEAAADPARPPAADGAERASMPAREKQAWAEEDGDVAAAPSAAAAKWKTAEKNPSPDPRHKEKRRSSVGRTQVVPIEADAPASAGGVAVDVNNDSPSGWGRAERANAKRRMKQGAVDALTQKAPSSEAIQRATKTGSAKVRGCAILAQFCAIPLTPTSSRVLRRCASSSPTRTTGRRCSTSSTSTT